jgi:hypothetical protein
VTIVGDGDGWSTSRTTAYDTPSGVVDPDVARAGVGGGGSSCFTASDSDEMERWDQGSAVPPNP